ncbi:MAG: hypothetical protein ABII27_07010 [bacterium]
MNRKILFFSALIISFVCHQNSLQSAEDSSSYIGEIKIQNKSIYDFDREDLPFMPYGIINKLHIVTRDRIIRRELLFRTGDELDRNVIAETERRLRSFSFIRVADINLEHAENNKMNAVVYTQDSWTTEPQISIGGGGGKARYAFGVEEKNFLGLGKELGLFYANDENDSISRQLFYNDPHFLPGHWKLESFFSNIDEGSMNMISVLRPYYKLDTNWAADVNWVNNNVEEDIYLNNETIASFSHAGYKTEVSASNNIYTGNLTAYRAGLGFNNETNNFYGLESASITALPGNYEIKGPLVSFQRLHYDYIKVKNVNTFMKDEDYNLGQDIKIKYVYGSEDFGIEKDASYISLKNSNGLYFGKENFLLAELKANGLYLDKKPRNLVAESKISYYNRIFSNQTLGLNMTGIFGKNLDINNQVVLGGLNGLRGYPAREFTGNKGLLFSLEDRIFWAEEYLSIVGVGGVVFFDSGFAWDKGESISISDLKSDIGFGFRFALPRSCEAIVFRLDFAYALDKVRDEDRFVISFGSGQSF